MFGAILVGLFLGRETRLGTFEVVDGAFLEWLNRQSRSEVPDVKVTLVEIDEASLQGATPWPWEPLEYALFLDAVLRFEPAVTAIEPILFWENAQPEFRRILEAKLIALPKVLLGAELGAGDFESEVADARWLPVLRRVTGDKSRLPDFPEVLSQPNPEYAVLATRGFLNLPDVEQDRSVRVVPLLFRCRGEVVPSFVLQAVMLWLKLTPTEIGVELNSHITLGTHFKIPIDSRGQMRLNLNAFDEIRRVKYDDVLLGGELMRASGTALPEAEIGENRLVFLGRTDLASQTLRLGDSRKISPVELFAGGAATIQSGAYLKTPSELLLWVLIAVFALAGFALACVPVGVAWYSLIAFAPVYALTAVTLFEKTQIALPLVMGLGLFLFLVILRSLLPEPEKR